MEQKAELDNRNRKYIESQKQVLQEDELNTLKEGLKKRLEQLYMQYGKISHRRKFDTLVTKDYKENLEKKIDEVEKDLEKLEGDKVIVDITSKAFCENDLEQAVSLDIKHISLYGLKIDENCYFYKNPPQNLPDEDTQADMYLTAINTLNTAFQKIIQFFGRINSLEFQNELNKNEYSSENLKKLLFRRDNYIIYKNIFSPFNKLDFTTQSELLNADHVKPSLPFNNDNQIYLNSNTQPNNNYNNYKNLVDKPFQKINFLIINFPNTI